MFSPENRILQYVYELDPKKPLIIEFLLLEVFSERVYLILLRTL